MFAQVPQQLFRPLAVLALSFACVSTSACDGDSGESDGGSESSASSEDHSKSAASQDDASEANSQSESTASAGGRGVRCVQGFADEPLQCIHFFNLSSCDESTEAVESCPGGAIARCEVAQSDSLYYEGIGLETAEMLCDAVFGKFTEL